MRTVTKRTRHAIALACAGLAGVALAGAASAQGTGTPPGINPNGQMLHVLRNLSALGAKPVYSVSVARARIQPTIFDAARLAYTQDTGATHYTPVKVANIYDIQVAGAKRPIAARVYDPQVGSGPAPVILYFHGGGWIVGNLGTYDLSDRALASQTGAIVLSVGYREGPEVRFPGAHDDAFAAYKWLLANAASIGADPTRIALAGESAGGNLAIDTAIAARDANLRMPVHELLVYPVAGTDTTTTSYKQTLAAQPLNRRAILWFVNRYIRTPADLQDYRLNVVAPGNDLSRLPPTTIVSAEIDPLRTEGGKLNDKLAASGVDVAHHVYQGVTHEFFGMGQVIDQARDAEAFASTRLRAAFAAVP